MSDEIHMESAFRHRDVTLRAQWHGVAPDEAMIAAEEWSGEELGTDRQKIMEALRVYLFADGTPEVWQNAAARGYAVMEHCTPWLLRCGRDRRDRRALPADAGERGRYGLRQFQRLCGDVAFQEVLGKLLGYIFPPGKGWLLKGTRRAYLLAMQYQPWLVMKEGKDLTYEDLAAIFEPGLGLTTKRQRNAARSRWSARFQELVRKPIERAGGTAQVHKSATARAKMAASAMGNQNRLRNRSDAETHESR